MEAKRGARRAIYTFTPNPAVDLTYHLENLELGGVYHPRQVTVQAGGKGLNTSAVLGQNGIANTAVGFFSSPEILQGLQARFESSAGLCRYYPLSLPWPNRISTCLVSSGAQGVVTTVLNQSDPFYTHCDDPQRWTEIWGKALALEWLEGPEPGPVVSIAGSFPAQCPPGKCGQLVAALRRAGALVLVDTSGPALLEAARAGAQVLKPNRDEILAASGRADLPAAVKYLQEQGAGQVFVSDGEKGLYYFPVGWAAAGGGASARGREAASPAVAQARRYWSQRRISGNPTGAGDALVAGLLAAMSEMHADTAQPAGKDNAASGDTEPSLGEEQLCFSDAAIARAMSWGAGAVARPTAGEIDLEVAAEFETLVESEEIYA